MTTNPFAPSGKLLYLSQRRSLLLPPHLLASMGLISRQCLRNSPPPRDEVNRRLRVHVPDEVQYRNLLSGDKRPPISSFCTGRTDSSFDGVHYFLHKLQS